MGVRYGLLEFRRNVQDIGSHQVAVVTAGAERHEDPDGGKDGVDDEEVQERHAEVVQAHEERGALDHVAKSPEESIDGGLGLVLLRLAQGQE